MRLTYTPARIGRVAPDALRPRGKTARYLRRLAQNFARRCTPFAMISSLVA